MTNHESPSDLQGFRRTEAGYFAAFVPVRADTKPTNVNASGLIECGVVRESTSQTATKGESSTSQSRGERSKLSGGRWQ